MNDLFPCTLDDVYEKAVERIIFFYKMSISNGKGKLYVAFSGGKDSVAIYGLCRKASQKLGIDILGMCEFHYHITCVDPPELVQFIKQEFPFVIRDRPKETMWQLIEKKKMPPTRLVRYCCQALKEGGGKDRFCITGVRWAESSRRKNTRGKYEIYAPSSKDKRILNADNDEDRRLIEHCLQKRKYICNPIVDWSDEQVWSFIRKEHLPIANCTIKEKRDSVALDAQWQAESKGLRILKTIQNSRMPTSGPLTGCLIAVRNQALRQNGLQERR